MFLGKIEKTDWNVKEIEKKIQENKMGRGKRQERGEKVPKWSREQFDDKVSSPVQSTVKVTAYGTRKLELGVMKL